MKNSPINPENFMKFFENIAGVKFIDIETGKPALETIAKNKDKEEKSDYDLWLEKQSDDVKREQEMGSL